MFENNCVDIFRVFIKEEPHGTDKVINKRFRLIFSVSIIDNCIAWLLCDNQNKAEINKVCETASQPGLSFTDEGTKSFLLSIPAADPLINSDVSGWDWSVNDNDFSFDCERRLLLNQGYGTAFEKLLRAHYRCMSQKNILLSDGTILTQTRSGVMPSGWKNTSSTNSAMRYGARLRAEYHLNHKITEGFKAKTMGDDCIESPFTTSKELMVAAYAAQGKRMTDVVITDVNRGFDFCSHRYSNGVAIPLNEAKQLFNILSYKAKDQLDALDRLDQYEHENRHNPRVNTLIKIILLTGWLTASASGLVLGSQQIFHQNSTVGVLTGMPRDCTVDTKVCWRMYSPLCHRASNIMTKQNRKTVNKDSKIRDLTNQVKQLQVKTKKKNKPFATTGGIIGSRIGSMFGNSTVGNGIGRWLGSGIGSIFGSGDYTMTGSAPSYNLLTNGKQIPQFSSGSATNIVCHREYLGDIMGTAAFNNTQYPLNPGIASVFPWLSTVAQNYQEYKFHGLVFEFRPLITDFVTGGAPGVVVMATNYNADAPIYNSKQQMENSEFAVSVKPTNALMHGVECAMNQTILPQRYVRTGAPPSGQDLRLYDYGNFQFATSSNPIQNLGELWVSYCVEFFKPQLTATSGGTVDSAHVRRSTVGNSTPLGTVGVFNVGSIVPVVDSTSVTWPSLIGQQFFVTIMYIGTGTAVIGLPGITLTNASLKQTMVTTAPLTSSTQYNSPLSAVTSQTYQLTFVATYSGTNNGNIIATLGTGGTLPTGSVVDIWITQLDSSVTS